MRLLSSEEALLPTAFFRKAVMNLHWQHHAHPCEDWVASSFIIQQQQTDLQPLLHTSLYVCLHVSQWMDLQRPPYQSMGEC